MNVLLIFIWIWAAFVAMAFWEAYVEGKKPWDKGKLGWKLKITKKYCFPAYAFYVWLMWIFLLTLPFIIYGWNLKLFGIILSAFVLGTIIEDFLWFAVNPTFKIKNWNSKNVTWYRWIKLGKIEFPLMYLIGILISVASWYILWR